MKGVERLIVGGHDDDAVGAAQLLDLRSQLLRDGKRVLGRIGPASLLAVAAVLCGGLACGPADPAQELRAARGQHRVELLNWVVADSGVEGAREAILDLRVRDRGSGLALPCLTVEAVLSGTDRTTETGRETLELNLKGLAEAGRTRLAIYDVQGRLVRVLTERTLASGMHEAPWDGRDGFGTSVSSGVYLVRLERGPFAETRKLLRLR